MYVKNVVKTLFLRNDIRKVLEMSLPSFRFKDSGFLASWDGEHRPKRHDDSGKPNRPKSPGKQEVPGKGRPSQINCYGYKAKEANQTLTKTSFEIQTRPSLNFNLVAKSFVPSMRSGSYALLICKGEG